VPVCASVCVVALAMLVQVALVPVNVLARVINLNSAFAVFFFKGLVILTGLFFMLQ